MAQQNRSEGGRPERKSVEELAEQYLELKDERLPASAGFSARLNMLWDLSATAPSQTEGRVLGIMGINGDWRESDVRKWLQKDVLPPREDLRSIVRFLVDHLDEGQD